LGKNEIGIGSLMIALALSATVRAQGQDKKTTTVYLTSDCHDTVGSNAAAALRERIRGSNGYSLAAGPTKGHSGFEIILTCAAIPGHEASASAVSYVFDMLLPDQARYFLQPGIGIVGSEGTGGWSENLFSQFDDWVSSTKKAIGN
jgi:hypothetical protein